MIFLILGLLLMAALAYYDDDFLSHWLWFTIAICYMLALNGCASNPYEQTHPGIRQQEDTNYFPQ